MRFNSKHRSSSESPATSIRRREEELDIARSSLYNYKLQLAIELKSTARGHGEDSSLNGFRNYKEWMLIFPIE